MEQVKRSDQARIRFEEFPRKSLDRVGEDEKVEAVAKRPWSAVGQSAAVNRQKQRHRRGFVDLDGMAGHAVTEVHAPGQRGRNAKCLVAEAGEEASPPPDDYAEAQRNDERPAGRSSHPSQPFPDLDRDDGAGERAGDRVRRRRSRIPHGVQRAEQPRAERTTEGEAYEITGRRLPGEAVDGRRAMAIDPSRAEKRGEPGRKVADIMHPGRRGYVQHA